MGKKTRLVLALGLTGWVLTQRLGTRGGATDDKEIQR